jgi:hypothetical protein
MKNETAIENEERRRRRRERFYLRHAQLRNELSRGKNKITLWTKRKPSSGSVGGYEGVTETRYLAGTGE